jgi:ferredoxin
MIRIHDETCSACGLCGEVCPNRIMKKEDSGRMAINPGRMPLCIRCGQCMAVCPSKSIVAGDLSYEKDFMETEELPALGNPFLEMIATRRAVRNFSDRPVSREVLEKIVQAISFAPPGFPPLKTEIVVVQDTAAIRKALPHMIEMYGELLKAMRNPLLRALIRWQAGKQTFNTVDRHLLPLLSVALPELKAGGEDTLTRNAPAMILFHASKDEDHRGDIFIAVTYGFLAAHALGLGGSAMGIIPPAVERNRELRKLFSIPEGNEVLSSMILGYPKYRYQRAIKRELKSVTWI